LAGLAAGAGVGLTAGAAGLTAGRRSPTAVRPPPLTSITLGSTTASPRAGRDWRAGLVGVGVRIWFLPGWCDPRQGPQDWL